MSSCRQRPRADGEIAEYIQRVGEADSGCESRGRLVAEGPIVT